MKNLDLNKYSVQEMNAEEMKNVDGGIAALAILGIILLVNVIAYSIIRAD